MSDTAGQGQETGTTQEASTSPPAQAEVEVPAGLQQFLGAPADTGTPPPAQGQEPTEAQLSEFAKQYLEGVPPEVQQQLAPFVQKWDAGVTRQFQGLHSKYAPFKEYVDNGVDSAALEEALQIQQMLYEDPKELANLIARNFNLDGGGTGAATGNQASGTDAFEDLHPAVKQFIDGQSEQMNMMKQAMEVLAQNALQGQQSSKQEQEDAALEQHLNLLRTEFGDFDEDYVLAKMEAGMDSADAVRTFQGLVNGAKQAGTNSVFGPTGQATPPILSGGTAPQHRKPITDASTSEVESLVQQVLDAANQS